MTLPARLTDPWFDAKFYGRTSPTGLRYRLEDGTPLPFSEAQGVMLWCPCGYGKPEYPLEGGRPHMILVPFANGAGGVPDPTHGPIDSSGRRPRWTIVSGASLEDLSVSPSIDVGDDHCWHGYITHGGVR